MIHKVLPATDTLGQWAAGFSVWGAITSDVALAWGSAIVAVGAILVPHGIKWYRDGRAAKRAEDGADFEHKSYLDAIRDVAKLEVRFTILEKQLDCCTEDKKKLEDVISDLKQQLKDLRSL